LEILYYNELDSTQEYLTNSLKENKYKAPIAIVAKHQSKGRGSRGNEWIASEGNLYLSFAITLDSLPSDLKIESISIYFAIMMRLVLKEYGSSTYIKWPNDFYIDDKKIGGIITSKVSDNIIGGIGINICSTPNGFATLDIGVEIDKLLAKFFDNLSKNISWQEALNIYRDDFEQSRDLQVTIDDKKVSLSSAILNDDGSININNQNIYSLR
jgi:BirA family biotin operon repressor/biotin-[acetyl-CoA-carboxylase] ligase